MVPREGDRLSHGGPGCDLLARGGSDGQAICKGRRHSGLNPRAQEALPETSSPGPPAPPRTEKEGICAYHLSDSLVKGSCCRPPFYPIFTGNANEGLLSLLTADSGS